jgi:ribonuclease P protein component
MFKRENRLVPGVRFKNSFFCATPQFVLKEKKSGLIVNRFGIIVSKEIDKRAVARNKIKRFFRSELINLDKKMKVGHDILIIVKKGILGRSEGENILTLKQTLIKAGLI